MNASLINEHAADIVWMRHRFIKSLKSIKSSGNFKVKTHFSIFLKLLKLIFNALSIFNLFRLIYSIILFQSTLELLK